MDHTKKLLVHNYTITSMVTYLTERNEWFESEIWVDHIYGGLQIKMRGEAIEVHVLIMICLDDDTGHSENAQ